HERLHLVALVLVGQAHEDRASLLLDAGGADLRLAERALDVLTVALHRGVDRLLDVDGIEEVRAALEVEPETHGLAPRPPRRHIPEDGRHEDDHGSRGQDDEQHGTIRHTPIHDFSRSFSRGSAPPALWTVWIAVRSTTTCTLGAISTVTVLSATLVIRP